MPPKKASELKKDDKILLASEELIVQDVEISEIGKQGKRKVRISASKSDGEKVVIIRPEDYPFNAP